MNKHSTESWDWEDRFDELFYDKPVEMFGGKVILCNKYNNFVSDTHSIKSFIKSEREKVRQEVIEQTITRVMELESIDGSAVDGFKKVACNIIKNLSNK